MFRRRLLSLSASTSAAAAVTISEQAEKLPIYPRPHSPATLITLPPTPLESHIGIARATVTEWYEEINKRVRGLVGNWIGVEESVERRIKSFKDPSESITPGILYVLTGTLLGSIIARTRGLPTRLFLPPIFFVGSAIYFLPRTTDRIGGYAYEVEVRYIPEVAEAQLNLRDNTRSGLRSLEKSWEGTQHSMENGIRKSVGFLQDNTGLKLREAWGIGEVKMKEVQEEVEKVVDSAQRGGAELKGVVDKRVESLKTEFKK